MRRFSLPILVLALLVTGWPLAAPAHAQRGDATAKDQPKKKSKKKATGEEEEKKDEGPLSAGTFGGLGLRTIGPALTSGRVIDLAVDPTDHDVWYVATAGGGVWKTADHGITFQPLFDGQGSSSIGCVTLDPNDPLTVWVGTGENNSQRSVGYGDGVYRSRDGGRSWENVGLKDSQHIGEILIDPRDSKVVWVAAQGPLWSPGGDRGLYKSTDGGATWNRVLEISENTGVSDIAFDPRNPDVVYAAAYQRRRRQWTLINGGPESALYKTVNGGADWKKLESGLPSVDLGRIGLAVAPSAPDTVYAIVEAARDEGGFYRSTDGGSTWNKRSGYVSGSPQYYQEIFVDPHDADRVYSMDVFSQVSEDGGATFRELGENAKHVDNHALWIDPDDTDHLIEGTDGGIYETYDRGKTWHFKENLPITQFYKIALSNNPPFYWVYGGTQDNFTLGGPARTLNVNGVTNRDWQVVLFGDGFEPQVDPTDPDIVYAQWQYGNLARFDKASGELVDIQPQPAADEAPPRWNWDSPVLISPHSPTRLYFASQRVYRSDDRGDNWRPVSPDLTRGLDRNTLPVMGRVWGVETVAKNASTSFYGNVVSFAESPRVEGLLYAGTDDGLVQVSEDGGGSWRKIESFPGVPEMSYVDELMASHHDDDTVYAAFNNHKSGDFKPYLLRSTDRGRTWRSVAGDLPERGSVYSFVEDPREPSLLFAGTEFGAYFSLDGGGKWIELTGGLPTVPVRDLEIQLAEDDLVLGTFGRGIYILDDYSPLRTLAQAGAGNGAGAEAMLREDAHLFPVPDAWIFVPATPLGLAGPAFLGSSFYTAPNPAMGATFTYHLKDGLKTRRDLRREGEMTRTDEESEAPTEEMTGGYPSWEDLEAEDREQEPLLLLTIESEDGQPIRRLTGPIGAGLHRVTWDLRWPSAEPVELGPDEPSMWQPFPADGPLVAPGTYRVRLARRVDGVVTDLGEARTFEAKPLGLAKLGAQDQQASLAFQRRAADLQRAALGAARALDDAQTRVDYLQKAVLVSPGVDRALSQRLRTLELELLDLERDLTGNRTVASRNEPTAPSLLDRVNRVVSALWTATAAPTGTQRASYQVAADTLGRILPELRRLVEEDLESIEREMEEAGAPWTPGRIPTWRPGR